MHLLIAREAEDQHLPDEEAHGKLRPIRRL
jgi:hypothetical protein